MVLWEITLVTAYLLGLRRTYRLALKLQNKIIPSKHSKIRHFTHRRTRAVFDVALKVHRSIQERDLEVGRNLGNRILRWLDKMKPSAEIRPKHPQNPGAAAKANKPISSSSPQTTANFQAESSRNTDNESRHLFASSRNMYRKTFPSVVMMMQPFKQSGAKSQCRHLSNFGAPALKTNYGGLVKGGVIRNDIMLWMRQN